MFKNLSLKNEYPNFTYDEHDMADSAYNHYIDITLKKISFVLSIIVLILQIYFLLHGDDFFNIAYKSNVRFPRLLLICASTITIGLNLLFLNTLKGERIRLCSI